MNSVVFLVLVFVAIIIADRFRKKKTKRRGKKSTGWFSRSKAKKTRAQSWYQQPAWMKVRDRRRRENNETHGLGKTRTGALIMKCARCGSVGSGHQIDHIDPRSKFPKKALLYSNTQVLCSVRSKPKGQACNQKKSGKIDGHNWRRIRSLPAGAAIAWYLRSKQVKEGRR